MTIRHKSDKTAGRRGFLGGTMLGVVGGSVASLFAQEASADTASKAKLTGLVPQGAPAADSGYTPGILAQGQRLIYVSGQGPEDINADMETQIRQTLDRIGLVLEAGGASYENIAYIGGYFVHLLRDLPVYRKVRKDYFVKPYPTSSCVGVTELAIPGLEIEIEAIAVV